MFMIDNGLVHFADVVDARHPIQEMLVPAFTPNDCGCDQDLVDRDRHSFPEHLHHGHWCRYTSAHRGAADAALQHNVLPNQMWTA
jgi:hypothetical protein